MTLAAIRDGFGILRVRHRYDRMGGRAVRLGFRVGTGETDGGSVDSENRAVRGWVTPDAIARKGYSIAMRLARGANIADSLCPWLWC